MLFVPAKHCTSLPGVRYQSRRGCHVLTRRLVHVWNRHWHRALNSCIGSDTGIASALQSCSAACVYVELCLFAVAGVYTPTYKYADPSRRPYSHAPIHPYNHASTRPMHPCVHRTNTSTHLLQHMSSDIHNHTPAPKSYTNFLLHPFVLHVCSTNRPAPGMGMGTNVTALQTYTHIYIYIYIYLQPDEDLWISNLHWTLGFPGPRWMHAPFPA